MKRTLPLIIIAAQILLMSGCKKDEKATSNQDIGQLMSQLVNELPEEFAFPDGTVVPKEDIDIKFSTPGDPYLDFAFIRYAEPIFISTLDDPDIVDFEKFEIREESRYEFEPKWIKVQKGDILENGLKVVSAQTHCRSVNDDDGNTVLQLFGEVKTEGGTTFGGILQYFNNDDNFCGLNFYPDSTEYKIPVIYNDHSSECEEIRLCSLDTAGNRALVCDGGYFEYFRFKSKYSRNVGDFKGMFTENTLCGAKVTFKDIVLGGNTGLDGEIMSIKPEA